MPRTFLVKHREITLLDHSPDDVESSLEVGSLNDLIASMALFIKDNSIAKLKTSNIVSWLTYALDFAVKNDAEKAVSAVCGVMETIAQKNPEICLVMLNKEFTVGKYGGKTAIYVWFDILYNASFEYHKYPMIRDIINLFSYFLNISPGHLIPMLTKNVAEEDGSDSKRRPILLLILALHQASRIVGNDVTTRALSEYLVLCIKKLPALFNTVLTEEISEGALKNKDMIYLLANTLTEVVKWSPETVKYICASLAELREANKELLLNSLMHVVDTGPHAGLHPLHLILMSLVSSLFIENNHLAVTCLLNFFTTLRAEGEQPILLRGLTISDDSAKNPNGIILLVRALSVAVARNEMIEPLVALLSDLIETSSSSLGNALVHKAFHSSVGFYKRSALEQLITIYSMSSNMESTALVDSLIIKLAKGNDALQFINSLTAPLQTIFIKKYGEAHELLVDEMEVLLNLNEESLQKLVTDSSSVEAFINQIRLLANESRAPKSSLFLQAAGPSAGLIVKPDEKKKVDDEDDDDSFHHVKLTP